MSTEMDGLSNLLKQPRAPFNREASALVRFIPGKQKLESKRTTKKAIWLRLAGSMADAVKVRRTIRQSQAKGRRSHNPKAETQGTKPVPLLPQAFPRVQAV